MRALDPSRYHASAAVQARRGSPHADRRPTRRPSLQLISDGVLASYIHDISQRHRRSLTPIDQRPRHIPDPWRVMEIDARTDE